MDYMSMIKLWSAMLNIRRLLQMSTNTYIREN